MIVSPFIMQTRSIRLRRFALRTAGRYKLHQGTLPDFIIVGAQKGGTTSLEAYLREHPDVLPCSGKEVHYFDGRRYLWGDAWYRRQFMNPRDLQSITRFRGRRLIGGEATPYYLYHPQVAERISRLTPNAKLIALLRDPVARAYSQYQHNVRYKKEPLSFAEALQREDAIVPAEHARMTADPTYRSEAHHRYSYKLRGCYAEQVERYYRYFPRDQLLILRSEDLFARPQEIYDEALEFLGLPEYKLTSTTARNAGCYADRAVPQEDELRRYFKPHNQKLYELIGRDMGW
jgi:hypothetical protein